MIIYDEYQLAGWQYVLLLRRMKHTIYIALLLLLACSKPENKIYVVADNAHGLHTGNPVEINGFKIGYVTKMSIRNTDYKIVAEVKLDEGVEIPGGSNFQIASTFMGQSIIDIRPAKNATKSTINVGDTVIATEQPPLRIDSLIEPLINKLIKADSIFRLNNKK